MRRPRSALEPFSVLRAQCAAQRRSLCRPAGTQLGAHHWMDWAVRVPTMETKERDRRAAEAMVTPLRAQCTTAFEYRDNRKV